MCGLEDVSCAPEKDVCAVVGWDALRVIARSRWSTVLSPLFLH